MAAFTHAAGDVPAVVARGAAAVDTDVEPGPVIDRRHHRRRFGVRPRGKICGTRGRRRAQRNEARSDKQQFLHDFPNPVCS